MTFAEFITNPLSLAAIAMLVIFIGLAVGLLLQNDEFSVYEKEREAQRASILAHHTKVRANIVAQRADLDARKVALDARMAAMSTTKVEV